MKKTLSILFLLIAWFSNAQLSIVNLKIDNRNNPLGVDSKQPVFSWQLSSQQRNVLQTAYQILVSDDSLLLKKNTGNIWDSNKQQSSTSIQVNYKGKPLKSAQKYFWKVMVADNKGNISSSNIAYWQMGLLDEQAWDKAQWVAYENLPDSNIIVPAIHGNGKKEWGKRKDVLPLFRKLFNLNKEVKNATLFISGLGHFEAFINGKKVGNHFLDPGWTKYNKQALYVSFDVKAYLQIANNAIAVMLGNGFYYIPSERYRKMTGAYGYPKMICRLIIEYADGTTNNIVSDESWKTDPSPITFSSLYGGEDYDARLEQKNWNDAYFNDEHWKQAIVTTAHSLKSQTTEPVQVMQIFEPVKSTQLNDKVWVFDMGQNMSGIPQITVQGARGDTIKIFTAELLKEDGSVNQKATGSPSYYLYVLKGGKEEIYQPHFSYYGYRYVQVENISFNNSNNKLPRLIAVKGLHTRNAATTISSFTSSNELFNQTHKLIDWSIKSNIQSVFTDCPHRERLGWLEQVHLMGNSIQYNYDIHTLCNKILQDIQVEQNVSGFIPSTVPEYTEMHFANGYFRDSPEWGSTAVILPWCLYQWYGDKNVLINNYKTMQRYVAYLGTKDSSHLLMYGLSDWYDLGANRPGFCQLTPLGLTATAYYYYDLTILEKTARLLNKLADANKYTTLAKQVKAAFNKVFFNNKTKQYGSGSQTSNAIALYMGLVEEADRNAVIENLVNNIQTNNYSITTGDIGYRYLLQVLQTADRDDIIYRMNNRSDVPGYGYQIAKGATALTESWQALSTVSNNHLMLGHLMEWFYQGLAGIGQAANSVGYKSIIIKPAIVGDVTFAKASYQCAYGLIESNWKKEEDVFKLNVVIPANTTASVYLPMNKSSIITQNGVVVKPSKFENGKAIIHIGSGDYIFVVK
jgi:alpha-L-rhamnosidase